MDHLQDDIRKTALEIGFQDIGFTTAEPFETQKEILDARQGDYAFLLSRLDLANSIDPGMCLRMQKRLSCLWTAMPKKGFHVKWRPTSEGVIMTTIASPKRAAPGG